MPQLRASRHAPPHTHLRQMTQGALALLCIRHIPYPPRRPHPLPPILDLRKAEADRASGWRGRCWQYSGSVTQSSPPLQVPRFACSRTRDVHDPFLHLGRISHWPMGHWRLVSVIPSWGSAADLLNPHRLSSTAVPCSTLCLPGYFDGARRGSGVSSFALYVRGHDGLHTRLLETSCDMGDEDGLRAWQIEEEPEKLRGMTNISSSHCLGRAEAGHVWNFSPLLVPFVG